MFFFFLQYNASDFASSSLYSVYPSKSASSLPIEMPSSILFVFQTNKCTLPETKSLPTNIWKKKKNKLVFCKVGLRTIIVRDNVIRKHWWKIACFYELNCYHWIIIILYNTKRELIENYNFFDKLTFSQYCWIN